MKYFRTIMTLVTLIFNIAFSQNGEGNKDNFELGASIYRELAYFPGEDRGHWHAAVFKYFTYFDGEYSNGDGMLECSQALGVGNNTNISYYSEFIGTDISKLSSLKSKFLSNAFHTSQIDPYHGAFTKCNTPPTTLKDIANTASAIAYEHISYTWIDMLDAKDKWIPQFPYWGEDWNGTIGDISDIRCDGVVEYSYEKNGIIVSNSNNISTPGNSHLDAHNVFHTNEYNEGELCPRIQAGEDHRGSGTNHSTFDPLISADPTSSNFLIKQFPEYTQLNFKIGDNASVKAYVMLQIKKPSESTWNLVIDENGNKWKFRAVDLTNWNGTEQNDNFLFHGIVNIKAGSMQAGLTRIN